MATPCPHALRDASWGPEQLHHATISGSMNRENAKTGGRVPSADKKTGQGSHLEGNPAAEDVALTALVSHGGHYELALRNAVQLWAEANTAGTSDHREDLIQAKITAVRSFFRFSEKELADVTSMDVRS